jgi:hypothetical protein
VASRAINEGGAVHSAVKGTTRGPRNARQYQAHGTAALTAKNDSVRVIRRME